VVPVRPGALASWATAAARRRRPLITGEWVTMWVPLPLCVWVMQRTYCRRVCMPCAAPVCHEGMGPWCGFTSRRLSPLNVRVRGAVPSPVPRLLEQTPLEVNMSRR
jgi:hypothetical protein